VTLPALGAEPLWLGLDTGGTYTDAVILDPGGQVLATAKALTTRQDLAIGLGEAIRAVVASLPVERSVAEIGLVSVSTTLATNAVVENQRRPICALLIGYEPSMLTRAGLSEILGDSPHVLIPGGHDAAGEEVTPLGLDAARAAIATHADKVDAFAISGIFSVRNPDHEIRLRALVREMTAKPVTCGHELTSKLDAVRRAVTVALNAQLTPQLRQLVEAVEAVLGAVGVRAPLMVVKGDGSLMAVDVAVECPVETILSGPAASVVGARFLTGLDDFVMSDMGGTTTDIAIVRDGQPVLDEAGATVGGWNTMVRAIDVRTYGLGGDSEIGLDPRSGLTVGPRRVVPLSLLASTWPGIVEALQGQAEASTPPLYPGRFAYRLPQAVDPVLRTRTEQRLWARLETAPKPLDGIVWSPLAEAALRTLVGRGLVVLSGLTPSDAMHILGGQDDWNVAAASLGTGLLIRAQRNWLPIANDEEIADLATRIREAVVRRTGRALCETAFAHDPGTPAVRGHWGPFGEALIDGLVRGERFSAVMRVPVSLALPLVAVGAPVRGYYAMVAERLGAALVIPDHAAVTNAIGAVAGIVRQSVEIVVTQPEQDRYRLHGPEGTRDFHGIDMALEAAESLARDLALEAARRAGAPAPAVETSLSQRRVERPGLPDFLVEAMIRATATGRPQAGR
jgi:N-methylhydantoinase A/oxoprolinase/acetone carboxylase beta subunit